MEIQLQSNGSTKKIYEGGRNQTELIATKKKMGFESDEWVTFLQAGQMGLKIKKGAKGSGVFKGFESFSDKDEKTGKITTSSRPLGFARVFNLDQTEPVKQLATQEG